MIGQHTVTWRRDAERVAVAKSVLAMPEVRDILAAVELDHPAKNIPKVSDGFGSTEWLGVIKGYEMCLARIRELGVPLVEKNTELKATWGVDEQNQINK